MRAMVLLLCWVALGGVARADEPACPVPDDLAHFNMALPAAQAEIAAQKRLIILAVGGGSIAGIAAGGAAFTLPSRLQARLRALLPGTDVTVVNRGVPGLPARDIAVALGAEIAATDARLVIWAAGGIDAAARQDIGGFSDSLQTGIDAAHQAGADVLLIDPQYAPSIARIVDLTPYRDAVQGVAAASGIGRLRRYDLMRGWSEDGVFDFDASGASDRVAVARRLFDCLASVLANGIADALR